MLGGRKLTIVGRGHSGGEDVNGDRKLSQMFCLCIR